MSVLMVVRTILNHIAPVFGYQKFTEVANNYGGGGRSFKDAAMSLETMLRKIADSCLHSPIRKREPLPTATQVEFRGALDFVLQEVVRIIT